jgi:hypothetical protein
LKCLLDGKEVQSAFNHDEIMSSSTEKTLVQMESEKIAKNAYETLKKTFNEENSSSNSEGSVGKFGKQKSSSIQNSPFFKQSSFDPEKKDSIEINSKNILNKMKDKKVIEKEKENLMKEIYDFIKVNKKVKSSELVSKFKNQAKGEIAILFKSMLKEIAYLDKKEKVWMLKE